VIHLILLQKIDKLLPKWIKTWIAEYLNKRQQRVKSNNTVSEWISVEAGVIQGSVLGPILFLMFISDINQCLPQSTNLTKFADDILTYEKLLNVIIDSTQQAVDSIQRWAEDNKMKLNVKKTKHMYINTKGDESTITLYNQPLENVDNYKYLGVNINKNLNHDIHWGQISRTTNSQIYLMKQLKQLKFKQEIIINVYRSLTLSHYTYSAPLLISTSANAKNDMTKQQHRFL
jgi:ribonucleases P/MRP protein subunit RPP40